MGMQDARLVIETSTGDFEMNNEPAAWMTTIYRDDNLLGRVKIPQFHQTKPPSHFYDEIIPLYTHPAKTLTDEKIINIIQRLIAKWTDEFKNYENDSDEPEENKLRDDVFAILRKAQEK